MNSYTEWLSKMLFDETFAHIHRLALFDYSLLVPYFLLLGILAIYGAHRYVTIYRYRKLHRNLPSEPPERFHVLPRVTIQLPLHNERFVVDRLLRAVTQIRYPHHLLQIQVLDDSTDDTHAHTERLVGEYRADGYPVEYHHRENRHGYKAGALEAGLATATGELIAVFDADFVPNPGFLEKTVHHFTDPGVGLVQTRWSYLNREYSLLTEVQAMMLDAHFFLEHGARSASGLFFNFNGTAGIMRRAMIEDAGGWQHDTLTEDSDLSYRAQLKGWRFVYLPDVESPSELPVDVYGFQVQQSRWAKGLTQVAIKLLPRILKAPISWRHKLEAFFHLTPNISFPIMVVVSLLLLPVMIVRFYMGWYQMMVYDMPLIMATFVSILVFYVTAQRVRTPGRWGRSVLLLPMLVAAGIGLTLVNTKAVLEACFRKPSAFARTPKYAIDGNRRERVDHGSYRRKSGLLPYLEIAMGVGFCAIAYFAVESYNFLALPFLLMFVGGYFWAGFGTLHEEYRGRLQWERAGEVGTESAP